MQTSENNIIFEKYIASLFNEADNPVDNRPQALVSKLPEIIRTLEDELKSDPAMKHPEVFRIRAHMLIVNAKNISKESKVNLTKNMFDAGFIKEENGKNKPKENSINLMLTYLRNSVQTYEQGLFAGGRGEMAKAPQINPVEMGVGDIVKYIGPPVRGNPLLNPDDDYIIITRFERGENPPAFNIARYARHKLTAIYHIEDARDNNFRAVRVDENEPAMWIDSPGLLRKINTLRQELENDIHQRADEERYLKRTGGLSG